MTEIRNGRQIEIYDTTLRDGTQREGISLSMEDKLKITRRLDAFGVDYIEGGYPGSNPKDAAYFERVRDIPLRHAKITAFGMTCRVGRHPEDDANVRALIASGAPVVTVVAKSWTRHVHEVIRATLEENLRIIRETISYIEANGRRALFDAEHFFDGYIADPEYALETLRAALEGGADTLVICDTNGGVLPKDIVRIVREVQRALPEVEALGIHTHNDAGVAVANSLMAVDAGCNHVQGTINGYGERCGNADLCSIIPSLALKMGAHLSCLPSLPHLTDLSRYVAEVANLSHDAHLPYVGASAFAHKGGMHVAATRRDGSSYQHIDPESVGNGTRILVSDLAGRGSLLTRAEQVGLDINTDDASRILGQIKELENQGFSFEGAEASVEMMLRRSQPGYMSPFELVDFMAVVEHRKGRGLLSEASVKVLVNGEVEHTVAEGNGPVNALDMALRKALLPVYPEVADIRLTDYKVRILDGESGTASQVRVLIDSEDGRRQWSSVGASTNIIEASWRALVDSIEYAITSG